MVFNQYLKVGLQTDLQPIRNFLFGHAKIDLLFACKMPIFVQLTHFFVLSGCLDFHFGNTSYNCVEQTKGRQRYNLFATSNIN